MKKYIFLTKGDETKIIAKETLNRVALSELKKQGFKKHHLEVEAENEQEAIEKLHKDNEDNLNALGEFSGNILYAVMLLFLMVALFYFTS